MICIRNKNVQENVKGRFRIVPFYEVTDNYIVRLNMH